MSVIIRLQNLPWSANALDIRGFFRGLAIPDGGVHIVGGENGDAFIAFSTDEDARQAMMHDRGKINEVQIRLLLSSRAEMQKVIETARQQSLALQLQMTGSKPAAIIPQTNQQSLPTPQPPVITTNSLHTILSNQAHLQVNNFNPVQAYTSVSQQQKSSYAGSADVNRTSRETSRDRRRSDSKERRRSRSNDRSGNRRRRDRSRTRSRDRKLRRGGSRRSRSRDRSHERSRDRSRDRSNRDRDRNGNRGSRKDSRDVDSGFYSHDRSVDRKKSPEKSLEPPKILPPTPMWNILPTNAYTTTSFAANYTAQALQSAAAAGVMDPEINSAFNSPNQSAVKMGFNSPSDSNASAGNKSAALKPAQDVSALSFLNINQLENRPTFAFQNPYTQASNSQTSNNQNDSSQSSMMKDQSSSRFQQSNQYNKDGGSNNQEGWQDAFGRNIPKGDTGNKRFEFQRKNENRKDIEEENSCVKISNMCPSTSYSDIRRFFSGLYIPNNGIKMINDPHGLRVGTAFIRFVRALNVPKALVRDGTTFKNKKISLEAVSDAEFAEAVDSFKPARNMRYNDNNNRGNYDHPRYNDNKREERDSSSYRDDKPRSRGSDKPFSILYVKDIPPYSTQQDVMKMFSSYTILDILLTHKPDNRREIIAYVKFHRVEDAQAAYEEHSNHRINQRPVRIHIATEEEYEDAKEQMRIENERQLKEQKEQEEIENRKRAEAEAEALAKADNPTEENGDEEENPEEGEKEDQADQNDAIAVDSDDRNRDSTQYNDDETNADYEQMEDDEEFNNEDGENYFNDESSQQGESKNSNPSNPFNGIPSLLDMPSPNKNEPEKNSDPRLRQGRPSRFDTPKINPEQMAPQLNNFILIKNCEYKTSIQMVGEYFMSHNFMPNHIEMLRNHRNQPCGEFILELRNGQEAEQALCLNNNRFNSRALRVSLISPQQIADRLNKPFMNFFPSNGNFQQQPNNMMMMMQNQGPRNNNFNNMGGGNYNNNRNGMDRSNMFSPDNQGGGNHHQFRGGNNNMMGPRNFNGPPNNMNNMQNNRKNNPFNKNQPNANVFEDSNQSNNEVIDLDADTGDAEDVEGEEDDNDNGGGVGSDGIPEKFTRPGCVVEMENVPYRSDLKDIIEFFDGFKVKAEDIIRRYNDDGSPTGDARVAFNTPEEAKMAFETKRQKSILNRTIFLNLL
ncbi:homeobox protein 2 [Episyrphus balteatus]|uniref:homeobox protein 2 n=1 Tax=Episyrphus balteatus TaxID=286459 RepID=UPI0024860722|nr:homeobox protein 2 [Episyrphus balteatus]